MQECDVEHIDQEQLHAPGFSQQEAADYLEKKMRRSIRLSALNLLARREHGRHELLDKLQRRSSRLIDSTVVSIDFDQFASIDRSTWSAWAEQGFNRVLHNVLDTLVDEGLQCDQRFASAYVDRRARAGFGPHRIKLELRSKGVDIDSCADFSKNWLEVLENVARKKCGNLSKLDLKERAALTRFLRYKGFYTEDINQLLSA